MSKKSATVALALFLFGLTALGVGWVLSRSHYFQTSTVQFEPELERSLSPLMKERIYARLRTYLGKNIFSLRLEEIAVSIRDIGYFENIRVRRIPPNALRVDLDLRKSVLQVVRRGSLVGIDPKCEAIGLLDTPLDLPVFVFSGELAKVPSAVCAFASQMIHDDDVASFHWSETTGLSLYFLEDTHRNHHSQLIVHLGFEQFEHRLMLADKTLALLGDQAPLISEIDAVYPRSTVVRLKNSTSGLNLNKLVRRENGTRGFVR